MREFGSIRAISAINLDDEIVFIMKIEWVLIKVYGVVPTVTEDDLKVVENVIEKLKEVLEC